MATPSDVQRQDVCGLRIDICVEFDRSGLNYAKLCDAFVQHRTATDATTISTLVPRDAEIVTLITTATETFVLFPEASGNSLFMVRPSFSARHIVGADSVAHGWLYRDRRQRTHVAVFDASRLKGVDLRAQSALQRHTSVHAQLNALPTNTSIHYHWSGHEEHCMRPFHHMKLGFDLCCIARLPDDLAVASPGMQRVLPCLLVADGDLRPPRIVLPRPR